jgi:hypothetical protein
MFYLTPHTGLTVALRLWGERPWIGKGVDIIQRRIFWRYHFCKRLFIELEYIDGMEINHVSSTHVNRSKSGFKWANTELPLTKCLTKKGLPFDYHLLTTNYFYY